MFDSGAITYVADELVLAGSGLDSLAFRVDSPRAPPDPTESEPFEWAASAPPIDAEVVVLDDAVPTQRVLSKSNFSDMRVVGQFNRGFIIARLGADLFILD